MTKFLKFRTLWLVALAAIVLGAATWAAPSLDFWNSSSPTESPERNTSDSNADHEADRQISILTFNLRTGSLFVPNVEDRANAVRSFIQSQQPDVVALQEVSSRTGIHSNIGKTLARQTDYELRWKATHRIPLLYEEGIAILSRWPIEWSGARKLPNPEAVNIITRAVLGARVKHPHRSFEVFVTHLTTAKDPQSKIEQTRAVRSFVEEHAEAASSWVVGDFNAEPDSRAIHSLISRADPRTDSGGWIDAWRAARPDDPGATVPAHRPKQRIDYVFTVRHPAPSSSTRCERVFDSALEDQIGDLYPSDHLGVYCSFPIDAEASDRSRESRRGVR